VVEPVEEANLPTGQSVGEEESGGQKEPLEQSMGAEVPGQNEPAGQPVHTKLLR